MSNPPPKPLFDREMWTIVDKRGRIVCAGKDPLIYRVCREAWLDCEDGDRVARVRVVVSEVGTKKGRGKYLYRWTQPPKLSDGWGDVAPASPTAQRSWPS
jgi:hypothetical protein